MIKYNVGLLLLGLYLLFIGFGALFMVHIPELLTGLLALGAGGFILVSALTRPRT